MRSAIHFFSGSLVLYVLMAACSASNGNKNGSGNQASAGNASMSAGLGGMTSASGGDAVANAGGGGKGASATGGDGTVTTSGMGGMLGEMMDPIPEADAATSGTRLKARYYVGADGSKQFIGWRDTMRNEDCSFATAEAGMVRCLPAVGAYATFYADAGCSQPLATVAKPQQGLCGAAAAAQPPAYVYDYKAYICGSFRVAKVAAETTPAAVWVAAGANCTASTVQPQVYTYYSTNAAENSAFVAATTQVE
jgi:hypothetical protein